MDNVLSLIPTQYLPYITAAITIAAVLAVVMPAPKTTSGLYYWLYQAVNTIAINFGHAKNLSAPESKGIVGGPTAISNPQIATTAMPAPTKAP